MSHSTPEAEIVSANAAVRMVGLPALDLWEVLLRKDRVPIDLMEDNDACIKIMRSGKNPSMKHISRTHGVQLSWLHEVFSDGQVGLLYEQSD